MSKYTTTIRELIDGQIEIFDFDYPFYNDIEGTKDLFEEKFKNVFMFHEIAYDEVDIFKHYLKTKLITLYPYYYQLYQTELRCKDIDFMLNKDLKETFRKEITQTDTKTGNTTTTGENTNTVNSTINASNEESSSNEISSSLKDEYDDITVSNNKSSNALNGVSNVGLEEGHLTERSNNETTNNYNLLETNSSTSSITATSNNDTTKVESGEQTINNTVNESLTNEGNSLEEYELISQGNIGVTSSAELLEKWRRVIIDIDMMILNDLATLFLKIY